MKLPSILRRSIVSASAAALLALLGLPIHAETYTWVQTSGGPYDWNAAANWNPSTGFPIASSEVANVTTDLTAALTIRLRQPISVGTLNLGDTSASAASFGFTIGNLTGETHALTFDSGDPNVAAKLNLQSNPANTGTPTNTISAPVLLNSALEINVGGVDATNAQRIVFSNTIDTQNQPITITGGFFSSGTQTTISGSLIGGAAAIVTNNSLSPLLINGVQTAFLGKIVVNNRATGSNQTGLTISPTGSLASVGEFEINGYLSGGATQNGGAVHVGSGTSLATNPGQRLTQNTITFNGGSLTAGGQPLNVGETNRVVRDDVNTFNLNSGYSLLSLTASTASGTQRVLDVDTLNRAPGASLLVRAGRFNDPAALDSTTFTIGNGASFLKGNGDTSGTTMSIIPWMVAANTNASAGSSDTFATYTADGIRGLVTTTEYATSLTAGAAHNVAVGGVTFGPADTNLTVNSFRYTSGAPSNIGAGKTLAIASGGLILTLNNSGIGLTGDAAAGTLQFGTDETPAEGVIWSNGTNANTIGASIIGSGGLSKAGTGTLILTGVNNSFSGLTYVGSGVLQVGNGGSFSTLGLSNEIAVAAGATLSLAGGNMVLDTATLRLEQYGLFNGKVTLFPEVNDTIGALYLGDLLMPAGTYGAVGSQADFENDTWFTGTGLLTVVPEPGSAVLLLGGIAMVAGRRRRK